MPTRLNSHLEKHQRTSPAYQLKFIRIEHNNLVITYKNELRTIRGSRNKIRNRFQLIEIY